MSDTRADREQMVVVTRNGRTASARSPRGFTLPEVLVSLAVVALLVSLLLPAFGEVHETARRVGCASNVRQIGLALSVYTDDYDRALPRSWVWDEGGSKSQWKYTSSDTNVLRTWDERLGYGTPWDGLATLHRLDYLTDSGAFYCPSHPPHLSPSEFAEVWTSDVGEIRGNYQYRGTGPDGQRVLRMVDPASSTLVVDTLRVRQDLNHELGINVLMADLHVRWFDAESTGILDVVPEELSNRVTSVTNPAYASGNRQANFVSVDAFRVWKAVDEVSATTR